MKKTIGIPRALLYYKFFPFWKAFLEGMGYDVITSGPTNKDILQEGNKYAIDEICIPLKIYYGHVAAIVKEKPDYIFIPRYVSTTADTFMCPKFIALPDLIRGTFNKLPQVMEMEVNMKKKTKFHSAYETGLSLNQPIEVIRASYRKAASAYNFFLESMEKGCSFDEALKISVSGKNNGNNKRPISSQATIAVVGHAYNIFDSFVNMDMLAKLEKMQVKSIVLENLPQKIFRGRTNVSNTLHNYWGNEEEILSALNYLFEKKSVDGIVFLCSFCCGPDSLIDEITTRNAKLNGIPYTCIVIDEHSGQAGLITRLESFVDMVIFRKMMRDKQISNSEKSEIKC